MLTGAKGNLLCKTLGPFGALPQFFVVCLVVEVGALRKGPRNSFASPYKYPTQQTLPRIETSRVEADRIEEGTYRGQGRSKRRKSVPLIGADRRERLSP